MLKTYNFITEICCLSEIEGRLEKEITSYTENYNTSISSLEDSFFLIFYQGLKTILGL